jgi:hypothetical protein
MKKYIEEIYHKMIEDHTLKYQLDLIWHNDTLKPKRLVVAISSIVVPQGQMILDDLVKSVRI